MNAKKQIHLQRYCVDVKILAGKQNGFYIRQQENLDACDANQCCICKVLIPDYLWSMNSSFFIGLFGPSIKTLGEKRFREKYVFECNGNMDIAADIEQGIMDCM